MNKPANILQKIITTKSEELIALKKKMSLEDLRAQIDFHRPRRSLRKVLMNQAHAFSIISEIKRKSPSKGVITSDFDVARIAKQYSQAGARAISVLTDETYFGGSSQDLIIARQNVDLPILRKDFIIDEYQLVEAALWGADVILLIARILEPSTIRFLSDKAKELNLEVLFEIHDLEDLQKLTYAEPCILGVNNRDLNTFEVSIQTTEILMKHVPADTLVISESGVATPEDIATLIRWGVRGALVGESLMKEKNPGDALKKLMSYQREL